MRSLRMKMVMIMVILILALMLTTGAFLMSGVGNFYVSQFYEQMEETFTPEFIVQLQRLSEEDNAPAQMKALLMAQAGSASTSRAATSTSSTRPAPCSTAPTRRPASP